MMAERSQKSSRETHTKTMHLLTVSYQDADSPQHKNQILNWLLSTKYKHEVSVSFLQSTTESETAPQLSTVADPAAHSTLELEKLAVTETTGDEQKSYDATREKTEEATKSTKMTLSTRESFV